MTCTCWFPSRHGVAGGQRLLALQPGDAVLLKLGRSEEGVSVPVLELGKNQEQHVNPGTPEGVSHPKNVLENQRRSWGTRAGDNAEHKPGLGRFTQDICGVIKAKKQKRCMFPNSFYLPFKYCLIPAGNQLTRTGMSVQLLRG